MIALTDVDAWALTDIDSELSIVESSKLNYALYSASGDIKDDFDMSGEVELDFS